MVSTLPRRLAPLIVLVMGCSSSGLFNGRESKGRGGVDEAFADQRVSSDAAGNRASAGARHSAAPAVRFDSTADAAQVRQTVKEYLAVAAREAAAGNMAAARIAYEHVVQLEPAHFEANHHLAVIADNEGRFGEAERHYRFLLRTNPRNSNLLTSLGWSYLLQQRYDESEKTLKDALAVDPGNGLALRNLGWLYGTRGDYDQALAVFRVAGTEEDAQRAIAELFPRGRPADGQPALSGAPRNPFGPTASESAGGRNPASTRSPDRLARGPVSAPVPWQRQTDPPAVAEVLPRQSNPNAPSPRHGPQEAAHFDEVFAELDARGGAIRQVAYDEPRAPSRSEVPLINPKRPPPDPAVGGSSANERSLPTIGGVRRAEQVAANGANPPATPSVPDWPYRTETGRGQSDHASTASPPRRDPRSIAAQLGLAAGPGGLLFPLVTPAVHPEGR